MRLIFYLIDLIFNVNGAVTIIVVVVLGNRLVRLVNQGYKRG